MDFVLNVFSVAIGGLITWFASYRYYRLAGRDLDGAVTSLRDQNDRLQRSVNVLGRALEAGKVAEGSWDTEGNLIGLTYRADASVVVKVGGSGDGGFIPPPAEEGQGS